MPDTEYPRRLIRYYADRPMAHLADGDQETILVHLSEWLATRCRGKIVTIHDEHFEALNLAVNTLADSWQPDQTVRQWLAAAGERLGVDTARYGGIRPLRLAGRHRPEK